MKTLIIPMAGKSSRFPNLRPKWMLTHPLTSFFMCVEAIKGINLDFFDRVVFTCLEEHQDKYQFEWGLFEQLKSVGIREKSEIFYLKNQTASQSESVCQTINELSIDGYVYIKDSDGYFEVDIIDTKNVITYDDLNQHDEINARSKSYISLDSNSIVTNIVEKKVISSNFSVGGYGFEDAKSFVSNYEKIKDLPGECYVSNVIYEMMLTGHYFVALNSYNFIDWGTLSTWSRYTKKFQTIFCDIDGVLIKNSSAYLPPYIGTAETLSKNVEKINELYSSGFAYIVLTTSRPLMFENETLKELSEKGINFHKIIMGLPHTKRVLVNDFSGTNSYPSSLAINIARNSDTLGEYLI